MARRGPLSGIKILDITQFQNGPSATRNLCDYGADVLHIENPSEIGGGDIIRMGLPGKFNALWEAWNRGKRSFTVDLKSAGSREVMRRLVCWADVVVENFRNPDVMKGWGYGYDQLRAWKSDIIYASNSSYGPKGPRAGDGSFDNIVQAYTGAAVANGGGPSHEPLRTPWNLSDEVGAMNFSNGILMALIHKARTGEGLHLTTSQTGAMIQLQAGAINQYTSSGEQSDNGYASNKQDSGSFASHRGNDGKWFIFAAVYPKHWNALCEIIGRSDLIDDPRSKNHGKRSQNRVWLWSELAESFQSRPRADWVAAFVKGGIPVSSCNDYAEVVREEQLWVNGYLARVWHPEQGEIITTGKALNFSTIPSTPVELAPGLAEHTEQTLRELGFSDSERQKLVDAGIVTLPVASKRASSKL